MQETIREVQNNYKTVIDMWKQRAVEWDYEERYAALKLSGYRKGENLPIVFYGAGYEINIADGSICLGSDHTKEAGFDTAMSIYSLLYHSKKQLLNSGNWVPFRDVKRAAPFTAAFQREVMEPFARKFDGKLDRLVEAGNRLGFMRLPNSDAGFQAEVFSCVPIQFLFWDGDDEFPAQSNILFDANITDYVHEETVVMLAGEGTKRIIKAADL